MQKNCIFRYDQLVKNWRVGYKLETTDHDNGVKLLDNNGDCPFHIVHSILSILYCPFHIVHFTLNCPVRICCLLTWEQFFLFDWACMMLKVSGSLHCHTFYFPACRLQKRPHTHSTISSIYYMMLVYFFDRTLVERCRDESLQQHPEEACWEWTSEVFCAPAFDKVGTVYQRATSVLP
jgi:hypothetical protein